jgi:uncharacterized pyridoxamine 5'-phosphate oxidase family protein
MYIEHSTEGAFNDAYMLEHELSKEMMKHGNIEFTGMLVAGRFVSVDQLEKFYNNRKAKSCILEVVK